MNKKKKREREEEGANVVYETDQNGCWKARAWFCLEDLQIDGMQKRRSNSAVALFQISRKDLLSHDFEGVLKYFRVQLPKRFRTEEAAVELMQTAVALKVSAQVFGVVWQAQSNSFWLTMIIMNNNENTY